MNSRHFKINSIYRNLVPTVHIHNVHIPGTTQTLKPCVEYFHGAGLVTHRRSVQVSWTVLVHANAHTYLLTFLI